MEEKRKIMKCVSAFACVCACECASSGVCALFFRIQFGDCVCVCVCWRAYVCVSEWICFEYIYSNFIWKIQCQHTEYVGVFSFSSLSTSCCVCCRWNWLFLQFEFFFMFCHLIPFYRHKNLSGLHNIHLSISSWNESRNRSFLLLIWWNGALPIPNRLKIVRLCCVCAELPALSTVHSLGSLPLSIGVCVYFPWISCVACSDVTIEIILWYNGDQISNFILLKWQMFVIRWASTSSSPSSPFLCAAHQYTHSHTQYKRTHIDCTAAEIISHSHQCKTQSTHSLFRFTHFTLTYLPHKRVETCIDTHAHIRIYAVSGIQTHEYSNKSTNTTKKQQQQKHNMNDAYQFKSANHFQRIN